jgi:hypothetical protein
MKKGTKGLKEDFAALENAGRRKVVKTIVGGVTAVAAYHILPVNWSKPIIEQVFLPAHAQTSGAMAGVDPSIPVTPGHPDHPDYPIAPSHPDHPHNNPSAVIGDATFNFFSPFVEAIVGLTFNRIAQYTTTYTNISLPASDPAASATRGYTNQTIPTTLSPNVGVKGMAGDTLEVTVTNNVDSEVITKQFVMQGTLRVTVLTAGGCGSTFSLGGNPSKPFTVTITPNPGAGQSVTIEDIKDGSPVATFTRDTDANGEITQLIIVQPSDIGSTKGLRATYQGAIGICTVRVNP